MRLLIASAAASVVLLSMSPDVRAQTAAPAQGAAQAVAQPATPGTGITAESRIAKNWRARIVFKSGATQDLLWVGVSTDTFNQMRLAFWRHLNNEGPNRFNAAGPDGVQIAITWADVSAVTTWTD